MLTTQVSAHDEENVVFRNAQWQLKAIWQTDYFRNFMNPKKSENFTALSETYFRPMVPSKGPMT